MSKRVVSRLDRRGRAGPRRRVPGRQLAIASWRAGDANHGAEDVSADEADRLRGDEAEGTREADLARLVLAQRSEDQLCSWCGLLDASTP